MATAPTVMNHMHRLFDAGTLAGRPDAQLLDAFLARRDESAFAALVARHGPMVLSTCRAVLRDSHAAEDAFQATFLVLARRAASIRGRDALGGWLHRVAYRAAIHSARAAARRRLEERKAATRGVTPAPGDSGDDLRAVIHAEVERLPDALRQPVVLCDMQGLTREQAAAELDWTERAVRGRLERGRAKLRTRLARRGLAPSAFVVAMARETTATMPEILAESTVRVALGATAGRAPIAAVAALADRTIRTALPFRFKGVVTLAIALGLVGTGAGLMLLPTPQRRDGEMPAPMKPKMTAPPAIAAQPKDEPASKTTPLDALKSALGVGSAEYKGRVIDPDGKPIAGARVELLYGGAQAPPGLTTGPDGRFQFIAQGGEGLKNARVIAEADGFSAGAASETFGYTLGIGEQASPDAGRDLTIKLIPDLPVEGRVVDLEGRPVVGAAVRVEFMFGPTDGDLTPWLRAVKAREDTTDNVMYKYLKRWNLYDLRGMGRFLVPTDADGRFVLKGLGRDRLVLLKIEGPTIRSLDVNVITRPSEPFQAPIHPQFPQFGTKTYYGAMPRLVASPSRPIEGIVRETKTGTPIAGATVSSYKLADQDLRNNTIARTTSDARGHYRLLGMPRGQGNELMVVPPPGQPYLPSLVKVDDAPGLGPVALDVELAKGVSLELRLVDKATGKVLDNANTVYHAAADNPALAAAPGFREMYSGQSHLLTTFQGRDGIRKLTALPGRGALVVGSAQFPGDGLRSYPLVFGQRFRSDFVPPINPTHVAVVEFDIPKDAKTWRLDVALDAGRTLAGTVVDPAGAPLGEAYVYGLDYLGGWSDQPMMRPDFRALAIPSPGSPPEPRTLVFLHEGRKLAGWLDVRGDEPGPLRARLEPWAVARGRLVDPDGMPRPDTPLSIHVKDKPRLGGGSPDHRPATIRTDLDGRFRVEGLAPGLRYLVLIRSAPNRRQDRFDIEPTKPGEDRDLGTLKFSEAGR